MVFCRHVSWFTALFALIIILGFSPLTHAQESVGKPRMGFFWVNAGLGGSTNGVAGGINLSFQPSQSGFLLFSLRGIITSQILGDDIGDVACLVGYSSKGPQSDGYFSISTGVSYVSGTPIDATFGIPVEVQLFYTPRSFVGIGLQGFADFNKEETFYGGLICLQFGRLR